MHTFLYRWGVFVELRRFPRRAARLHDLERAVGEAEGLVEARKSAGEIAMMIDEATRKVQR